MKNRYTIIVTLIALFSISSTAYGSERLRFRSQLSPAQEVEVPEPGSVTINESKIEVKFNDDLSEARVKLRVKPSTNVVAAHFHCNRAGLNGPVAFGLIDPGMFVFDGDVARGTLTNADFTGADCVVPIGRPVNNIAALAFAMRDGLIYANVHTANNPAGEFRGQLIEKQRLRDLFDGLKRLDRLK